MSKEPVDAAGPWTIKSVGTATKEAINKAARQEGVTVGQWLDKRVAEWLAEGSPVHVAPAVVDLAGLAALADSARSMAEAAVAQPPHALAKHMLPLAKHMLQLTATTARTARGLRPRNPKLLTAPDAP
jgi:hypothetical protein